MTSPGTMISLIVDYHAAIGGQDPPALLAYARGPSAERLAGGQIHPRKLGHWSGILRN